MYKTLLKSNVKKHIRRGDLTIVFADGSRWRVGDGEAPHVEVALTDAGTVRALIVQPALALGELYMDDRLRIGRGSLVDLMYIVISNIRDYGAGPAFRAFEDIARAKKRLYDHRTIGRAISNVAHHYDLDAGLYDLFLDRDKQYSCAYFERHDMTLDEAQEAKKRHIISKLCLEPGQTVLDIGCGWGGLALSIARAANVHVLGVTLSKNQLVIAQERARRAGFEDRIEFRLIDYREIEGMFDRIVSVGMFEHVGVGDYDNFFSQIKKLLAPRGVALLHSIGNRLGPQPPNPWIEKYIFPGSVAPSLSQVLPRVERKGFVVGDIEILRLHYAETLRHWRNRFIKNRDAAVRLYDERFARMWEFYLAASEAAFRAGNLIVFQMQLMNEIDAVPLTRRYMYDERALEFAKLEPAA